MWQCSVASQICVCLSAVVSLDDRMDHWSFTIDREAVHAKPSRHTNRDGSDFQPALSCRFPDPTFPNLTNEDLAKRHVIPVPLRVQVGRKPSVPSDFSVSLRRNRRVESERLIEYRSQTGL